MIDALARGDRALPGVVALVSAALIGIGILASVSPTPAEQALRAATIAQTSRPFSLFVHAGGEVWYQPLAIYPSALLLLTGLAPEAAFRLPAMVAGMLTITLTYAFTTRVVGHRSLGALAGLALLAMPGFRVASQTAGADLLMVALVATWLVVVLKCVDGAPSWLLAAGGAALGACIYTQPAGVLAVPIFFALGTAVLLSGDRPRTAIVSSLTGVIAAAVPAVLWLVMHFSAYQDTFGRWAIHAAHIRSPWDGVVAFTRWAVMARRVEEYWHYFNPAFLFSAAVFGLPLVVLVPFGLWASVGFLERNKRLVTLGGFMLAPAAAVLLDVPRNPALTLMFLPLGATCAAIAVRVLSTLRVWRVAAAIVVLAFLSLTAVSK